MWSTKATEEVNMEGKYLMIIIVTKIMVKTMILMMMKLTWRTKAAEEVKTEGPTFRGCSCRYNSGMWSGEDQYDDGDGVDDGDGGDVDGDDGDDDDQDKMVGGAEALVPADNEDNNERRTCNSRT